MECRLWDVVLPKEFFCVGRTFRGTLLVKAFLPAMFSRRIFLGRDDISWSTVFAKDLPPRRSSIIGDGMWGEG